MYEEMDNFNEVTCVKFTNLTDRSIYHVKIIGEMVGCYSVLVYRKRGYLTLNLDMNCFVEPGTIIQGLMHTLGFKNHHNRVDRDQYLVIHKDNIIEEKRSAFKKMRGEYGHLMTLGLPYDYNSVMHYPPDAFGEYGPTMSVKGPYPGMLGQMDGLSRVDIASINRLYECWDHYLGDDIPGAIPYKEFHAAYMAQDNVNTTEPDNSTRDENPVYENSPLEQQEEGYSLLDVLCVAYTSCLLYWIFYNWMQTRINQ